jgi:hypothetical protein
MYKVKLIEILARFAGNVLDAKNDVTNPTIGELVDPPLKAIHKLLDEEYKKGYRDGKIAGKTK